MVHAVQLPMEEGTVRLLKLPAPQVVQAIELVGSVV